MTQIALPPATRTVGSVDPPGDMNAVITALTAMNATRYVTPTADTSGAADTANLVSAIAALPAGGGCVVMSAGTYYITAGLIVLGPQQYLLGPGGTVGRWAANIHCVGGAGGDYIRQLNTTYGGGGFWGGGVLGVRLEGSGAGNNANGYRAGDAEQLEINIAVENFTGTGSFGVLFDNQIWWTEKLHGTVFARNCTQHVGFNVGGATTSENSFGYLDLTCYLYVQADQDGVVVQNGALPYHGRLVVKGDVANQTGHVASNAVLRLTGQMPGGHPNSNYSQIIRCQLDIQVEVPSNASGLTFQPYGVYIASAANNGIFGCYGMIDLTQGGGLFQPCNLNIASNVGTFTYTGLITGDANLNPSASQPGMVTIGSKLYGQSFMSGSNGDTYLQWGDFFACTLSASITVNLNPSGQSGTISAPQRKTFKITQAAAGGPYTVTWPKPGSPSLTAPAVYWPGGSAPTMSAGASAVDVYYLISYDGVHWYGEALQALS